MILYLVRHGETAFNRDGLGLGRRDVPLTERGQSQAAAVARALAGAAPHAVYSSPLMRASEVAAKVASAAGGVPVHHNAGLLELDVGETEGLTYAEMRERFPEFLRAWGGTEGYRVPMPGGESLIELAERAGKFLADLAAAEQEKVAVVSHNFVIRLIVCELLRLPASSFRSIAIDLASITEIDWVEGRAGVRRLNDRCHLLEVER